MQVQAYLNFDGRCDEALKFYEKALGAKVGMVMRFKDAPDRSMVTPDNENKVMHAQFQVGDTQILASDGRCTGTGTFKGITLSLWATDATEADKLFAGLAEGGQVQMPLAKTFFAPRFGMLADKFGVGWMIVVPN